MPYVLVTRRRVVPITRIVLDPKPGEQNWTVSLEELIIKEKVWREDSWQDLREIADMKRLQQEQQRSKGKFVPPSEPLLRELPRIQEFMGDSWYDDGKPRETSKMTIHLIGSGVSLMMTDPDNRRSCFTQGASVREALEQLEAHLDGKGEPWRAWPKGFGRK